MSMDFHQTRVCIDIVEIWFGNWLISSIGELPAQMSVFTFLDDNFMISHNFAFW